MLSTESSVTAVRIGYPALSSAAATSLQGDSRRGFDPRRFARQVDLDPRDPVDRADRGLARRTQPAQDIPSRNTVIWRVSVILGLQSAPQPRYRGSCGWKVKACEKIACSRRIDTPKTKNDDTREEEGAAVL